MAIKSIFCGKSKNLCDVSHLLTLPVDKSFNGYGFWEVEINVEPDTVYTFSRENANQINVGGATYLGITNQHGIPNGGSPNQWLNHETVPGLCHQNVQITTGAEGKLWIFFSANVYNKWQNHENPFGYLQLEKGSIATEYVPYELTSYKSVMKVSDICQLMDKSKYPATVTRNGVTVTNNGDGTVTLNGTNTGGVINLYGFMKVSVKAGHYYYIYSGQRGTWGTCMFAVDRSLSASYADGYIASQGGSYDNCAAYLFVGEGASFNNFTVKPQFFDLTEMFGAGNEPKTVAEFKAKFPNDYYPYSPSCFVTSFDERIPCKTKNLFSSSTEVGTLEGGFGGPTVARNFEENKWYQGFTTNGYYSPGNILDFDIHPNSLYMYSNGGGYGMSRAIKCEPNTKYFISCSHGHISGGEGTVYLGYYDEGGNFISNLHMGMEYKFVVTTPSNCKWLIIDFTTRGVGKVYFSDIQLVKGTTATDYVPYGYV